MRLLLVYNGTNWIAASSNSSTGSLPRLKRMMLPGAVDDYWQRLLALGC
jgi:hypothetical protein